MVEPRPLETANFYRPCFNAHERGPPELKWKAFFLLSSGSSAV